MSKTPPQFGLAELLGWTTGIALWLAVLKWSNSLLLTILVGVVGFAMYLDWRFSLRFSDKYLGVAVVGVLVVLLIVMALFSPAVR